jgi:D-beta-D-heptose 7-phosphate kinase/D-beta-D-heptose 1-phosphate adenosyltransferase
MIVIGDKITDKYIIGTSLRLSPEAPVPVIKPLKEQVFDGGAGNVVANLRALGHGRVLFIHNKNQETKKTRIVCDNHIVCRLDEEEYIPYRVELDSYIINETCPVIISDYNKGVIDDPISIMNQIRNRDLKVFVDPKRSFKYFRDAFLIKANKKEFEEEIETHFEYHTAGVHCQKLCKEYRIRYIVVTLGAEGCFVYDHANLTGHRIHSDKRTVVDVTGAGDVFMAALAHYYHKGYSVLESAEKANKLAGISVSRFGTYILRKEDVATVEDKQTVVFTNGCFDVLHRGHFELLEKSKSLGHKLVVGLNSDASIRRLKGINRPFFSQENRKIALEAISYVDEVIIFDEDTPYELIKRVKPDIITKGGDYTPDKVVGNDMAKVVIIPQISGYSSTGVINALTR